MNYLAHARLSFGDPEVLLGNMISDYVKGKKKFDYPLNISNGIDLHRMIDAFTDSHDATREAKEVFRPHYRLYSGAIVDVVYDHFLATDPEEFTEDSLFQFSQGVYTGLESSRNWFPLPFAQMFPYMKEHNWLFNYRTVLGIGKSMAGLVRRAVYLSDSTTALSLFERNYQLFKDCYRHFWQEMKPYAFEQYNLLTENRK